MSEENYITASCTINKNNIVNNEKDIFNYQQLNAKEFLIAAYRQLGFSYPKFFKMDNLSKLGWLATEILLANTTIANNYKPEDIGVVLANKNSSIDNDIKYFETTKYTASPALFVYTLPNIVIGEICIKHNIKGENAFFIFEEFDANFITQYVNNLLTSNLLQCCICGWVEIVEEEYKAVLFLIEKKQNNEAIIFTKENLLNKYQL